MTSNLDTNHLFIATFLLRGPVQSNVSVRVYRPAPLAARNHYPSTANHCNVVASCASETPQAYDHMQNGKREKPIERPFVGRLSQLPVYASSVLCGYVLLCEYMCAELTKLCYRVTRVRLPT